MRVVHLNCVSFCPPSARLVNGVGGWFEPACLVGHCLLIESSEGLILVDAGLGLHDLRDRTRRLGRSFLLWTRPQLDPELTAVRQIARLGYDPRDVRHVLVTHLDVDHAGGLADFPRARVHVDEREFDAAMEPPTPHEARRYRRSQFNHFPDWVLHLPDGDRWMGLPCFRPIPELGDDLAMVSLVGHTRGHCGVAVRTEAGWLLHAGDAYYCRSQITGGRSPVALEVMARTSQVDGRAREANLERLGALAKTPSVTVFCAHDPVEWGALAGVPPPGARQPSEG